MAGDLPATGIVQAHGPALRQFDPGQVALHAFGFHQHQQKPGRLVGAQHRHHGGHLERAAAVGRLQIADHRLATLDRHGRRRPHRGTAQRFQRCACGPGGVQARLQVGVGQQHVVVGGTAKGQRQRPHGGPVGRIVQHRRGGHGAHGGHAGGQGLVDAGQHIRRQLGGQRVLAGPHGMHPFPGQTGRQQHQRCQAGPEQAGEEPLQGHGLPRVVPKPPPVAQACGRPRNGVVHGVATDADSAAAKSNRYGGGSWRACDNAFTSRLSAIMSSSRSTAARLKRASSA